MQLHNNSLQQLRPGSCNCKAAAKSPNKLVKRVGNIKSWKWLGEKGGPTSIYVNPHQFTLYHINSYHIISIHVKLHQSILNHGKLYQSILNHDKLYSFILNYILLYLFMSKHIHLHLFMSIHIYSYPFSLNYSYLAHNKNSRRGHIFYADLNPLPYRAATF